MAVRRESVVLTLEDSGFTSGMAKAAASTAALNKSLHDLDGTNARTTRSVRTVGDEMDVFTKRTRPAGREVDRLSGRLRLFADAAITIGPALAPIGAAVVPALAGMAAQLGAAAGAAGVAVLAFSGIGDALGSLNAYQLEPTEANLEKLNEEMTKIGPAGADFVMFLDSIAPQLSAIQDTARAGLLPGVQEGIESLLTMGPRVQDIVANIAAALGEMSANAGEALAGPRFREFFDYIENTAGPTLMEMGRTLGNVTEGLANMMVAFSPAANDFTGGLERMTASFAEWSRGLESNTSFQTFLDYVRESGPQVVDLLGSLIGALSGLLQAAAPVGAVVVPALTALADAFAAIATSPIGGPLLAAAAAFVAVNRAMQLGSSVYGAAARGLESVGAAAGSAGGSLSGLQKSLGLAAAAFAAFQVVDQIQSKFDGLSVGTEELTGRLIDLTEAGDLAALGSEFEGLAGSFDLLIDPNKAQQFQTWLADVSTLESLDSDAMNKAREQFEGIDAAMSGLVSSGNSERAAAMFDALASQMGLTGEQTEQLMGLLPGYSDALAGAENATRLAGDASKYLGNAEAAQARATRDAVAALREKRDAALAAFDAETAYRQALKGAREQAAKNTAGIRGNSDAALANRDALSQLASAWNDQSAKVRNNTAKYREAKQAFIETAEQMGVTKQRARELANEILAMPKSREIKIVADTSNAMSALYEVQNYKIADKVVRVHTVRTSGDGVGFVSGGRADGGTIPRAANGSTVPKDNKPYGDRYLYMLAPGEEVISNRRGQADRFRPLLKAINNAADGATVGGRSSFGLGASVFPDEMREFARATELSRRGLLAELRVRARLLDKDLEAHKSRLDALKSERDSIAASVKARLQSDIFANPNTGTFTMDKPDNFAEMSPEAQKAFYDAQWSVGQSLGYGQSQSPADILRADLERAREMSALVKRLKSNGLDGDALAALLDGGDMAQIQAYAGDRGASREYERLFNQRERVSSSVGAEAGNAAHGRAIREQTVELREVRKESQQTNKRLERLEELAKKNPKETGAAVGKEVNGAASSGQRRRS